MSDKISILINNLRYEDDVPENSDLELDMNEISTDSKKIMTLNGMPVTSDLLPDLSGVIEHCIKRLELDEDKVQAYVYPSSEIQAMCQQYTDQEYILALSSGIVNLLDYSELQFVVGHEIAHALFNHDKYPSVSKGYIEHGLYKLSRASEISADRVGYICCDDSDSVYTALMKICSGLSDEYLNYDVNSFIELAKDLKESTKLKFMESTHPPLVIRARALLWFSMSDISKDPDMFVKSKKNIDTKTELDIRVRSDLYTYVDSQIFYDSHLAIQDFKFWMYVLVFSMDGGLSADEQSILKSNFPEELITKLIGYFSGFSKTEALNDIRGKFDRSVLHLMAISQSVFEEELKKNITLLAKNTDRKTLDKVIRNIYRK